MKLNLKFKRSEWVGIFIVVRGFVGVGVGGR
jgi:hypothetical protein